MTATAHVPGIGAETEAPRPRVAGRRASLETEEFRHAVVEHLKKQGVTIVYSTHYMEEVERMCDRVAIVDHGKLLALDTVKGLTAKHGGESIVVVHRRGKDEPERIKTSDPVHELAAAVSAGGVDSASIHTPNLETVFLALTGRTIRD